jgi:hypothetical protein
MELPKIQDSMHFTPEGRRLLWAMGVLEPDPLRVEAEQWLAEHEGSKTPATRLVREALGPPVPEEWIQIAREMRGVK